MRPRLQLILLSVVLLGGCEGAANPVAPEPLPTWLSSLIRELESQPRANPPAYIARYEYRNEVVYFQPQRCCDVPSNVFKADGALMCHPDGGITGAGDGRCPDFAAERKNETIVWRDTR